MKLKNISKMCIVFFLVAIASPFISNAFTVDLTGSVSFGGSFIIREGPQLILNISNQTWDMNTNHIGPDLDDHFENVTPTILTYTASTIDNPNINITIDADNIIHFTQPLRWYGVEYVVFTASDGSKTKDSNNVTLTVEYVEKAPIILSQYPHMVNVYSTEEENQTFNVTFTDEEDDNLTVTWKVNNSIVYQINKTLNQANSYINTSEYIFINNYSTAGSYKVEVEISDGIRSANQIWILNVSNVNRKPYFTTISNLEWRQATTYTLDSLDNYVVDPDVEIDDYLSFNYVYADLPSHITITINPITHEVLFNPLATFTGTEIIYFTVTDSEGASNRSNNITLTVTPIVEEEPPGGSGGGGGGGVCVNYWYCTPWSPCDPKTNTSTRNCVDLAECRTQVNKPMEIRNCSYAATCNDGLKNCHIILGKEVCEEGIDCGGPCDPCEKPAPPKDSEGEAMMVCVNITRKAGQIPSSVSIESVFIMGLSIGENYSIAMEPFSIDCNGEDFKFIAAIPENYIDVQVLKCKGNDCYPQEAEYITELWCGGELIREIKRETKTLDPILMPIKIKEIKLTISDVVQSIESGDNKVKFFGEIFEGLVTIKMPEQAVEEPKNPYLMIIGTPLVLEFDKAIEQGVNTEVTMPFQVSVDYEESTISLYAKKGEVWDYINGTIDYKNKLVKAQVENIAEYVDSENKITFALMGMLDDATTRYNSTLNMVYYPEKETKDMILLIHGVASSAKTYKNMIDDIRLTKQPIAVYSFSYSLTNSMDKISRELMNLLESETKDYDNIYIVAHSAGGIIAQQALYHGDKENYVYTDKVKKAILIAVPNEGSPLAKVYENLFERLVNEEEDYPVFNLNSESMDDLIKGIITPRVKGIEYYVIAGTKSYELNIPFFRRKSGIFEEEELSDGVVTTKSAQHIGEGYINDKCTNYWELHLTHNELIKDPVARKVVERIIAEDIPQTKSLLGNNQYVEFDITDCDPEEQYVIIGKRIAMDEFADLTLCKCGNGICGMGEDEFNCPEDCATFMSQVKERPLIIIYIILLLILFISAIKLLKRVRITYYVKKKVVAAKTLSEQYLTDIDNELALIEKNIDIFHIDEIIKKLSHSIVKIIDYKFGIGTTYTKKELVDKLSKISKDPATKQMLLKIYSVLHDIKFSKGDTSRKQLLKFTIKLRSLISKEIEKLDIAKKQEVIKKSLVDRIKIGLRRLTPLEKTKQAETKQNSLKKQCRKKEKQDTEKLLSESEKLPEEGLQKSKTFQKQFNNLLTILKNDIANKNISKAKGHYRDLLNLYLIIKKSEISVSKKQIYYKKIRKAYDSLIDIVKGGK